MYNNGLSAKRIHYYIYNHHYEIDLIIEYNKKYPIEIKKSKSRNKDSIKNS